MTVEKVSVVIPSRDGGDRLRFCLAAIRGEGAVGEIVVADDGSSPGEAEREAALDPTVKVVRGVRSRGFAAAANAGMRGAVHPWILLLNNDTVPSPGAIAALRDGAISQGAHLASPLLVWKGRGEVLDNAGHVLHPDGLNWCRGRGQPPSPSLLRPGLLLLPSGAALLLHRAVLDRVGFLEEGFVAYGEDADYALRAARAGFTCAYVPDAVVHHQVSATYGETSLAKVYRVERNRARIACAHLPFRDWLLSPAWVLARHVSLGVASLTGRSRPDLPSPLKALPALALAHAASVAGVPFDLARRRRLLRTLPMDSRYRQQLREARIGPLALAGWVPPPWEREAGAETTS